MEEPRPFSVACDWCSTIMVGQVRRDQVGRMVVVQVKHTDAKGTPCRGSGRGIPTWPLSVEIRATGEAYELRIGNGLAREYPNLELLGAKLQEFGLGQGEAQRRISPTAEPGRTYRFEVAERRQRRREQESSTA